MMTERQLRAAIVDRIAIIIDEPMGHRREHHRSVLRGLVLAYTGRDLPVGNTPHDVLTRCGIPFHVDPKDPEVTHIEDAWLDAHGLAKDWRLNGEAKGQVST